MKKVAILFLWTYIVAGGVAQAATYYVSKSGRDDNSCAQARFDTSAKQTLTAAVGCMASGDTLLIREGTYDDHIDNSVPSGSSWSSFTRIAAYPGETVRLQPTSGDGVINWRGNVVTHSYVEFDRIIFDATSIANLPICLCNGEKFIRIQNSEVIGSSLAGSCANICGGTEGLEILNNVIHGGGTGGGCGTDCANYGIYTGSSNSVIDGNEIYDTAGNGMQIYNGTASNNIIRNNRVHDINRAGYPNPGAGFCGILIASGTNNQVYNNIIYNIGRSDGSDSSAGIGVYGYTLGTKIWNNTVYNNHKYGISIDVTVPDAIVQNNILYNNSSGAISNASNGSVKVDHNLNGTDPMFVNPSGGDFHLGAGSPAVDAAIPLAEVIKDFAGATRPEGGAPDIGAYESGGAQAATPAAPSGFKVVVN